MLKKRIVRFFWLIPLVFYVVTMAKTIGYVDAALILRNSYQLEISAWVNNHNLFSILGWLWMKIFPLGTEFFRLNLLSSIFGAFTVYFIFLTCYEYSKNLFTGIVSSLALMISHSLWWHSTMLEVYTLNTLLISLILYTLIKYFNTAGKKWIYASFIFWGLGISNHVLMGLFFPAFVLLLITERKNLSVFDIVIGFLFFTAGLSVFIVAFFTSLVKYGSLFSVIDLMTGMKFRSLMFSSGPSLFWLINYIFLLMYQYPSIILFFLFYGLLMLFRQRLKFDLFIIAALVPFIVWSSNYFVWDMYAFALPVYVLLSIAVCKGLNLLKKNRRLIMVSCVSMLLPFFLYMNINKIPEVRCFTNRYPMVEMVADSFDPAGYFLNPIKFGFNAVERYKKALFERLPEGSAYYDNVYCFPVHYYYQEIRKERPDLECPIVFPFWVTEDETVWLSARIDAKIDNKQPVYVSGFVFNRLKSELRHNEIERISFDGNEIFRLY